MFSDAIFARARKFCLALPEVSEAASWGHPNFRAGKKTFLTFEEHDGTWWIAFHLPALDIERLEKSPGFRLTPYGRGAWISLGVTSKVEWPQVQELILKSYGTVALKRMLLALDSAAARRR